MILMKKIKHSQSIIQTICIVFTVFYVPLTVASEQTVIALIGDSITVGFNASYLTPTGDGTTTRGNSYKFIKYVIVES